MNNKFDGIPNPFLDYEIHNDQKLEYERFSKLVFDVFETEKGRELLKSLYKKTHDLSFINLQHPRPELLSIYLGAQADFVRGIELIISEFKNRCQSQKQE